MSALPALVLRTAGTNCDGETVRALEGAGADVELTHLNDVVRDPGRLARARLLVLPGGFSYGDYVAAGRILGLELRTHLGRELRAFADDGGLILGVCNGFQVLVELGLFEPERDPAERTVALTDNASGRFECRWVTLRSEASACPWLVPGELAPVPIAHAEGRVTFRDAAAEARFEERGQIALRYVDPAGAPGGYPINPNGSAADCAGLCDPSGRILGLMPHPERNLEPWNHPRWTRLPARSEGEGRAFYRRMVEYASAADPSLTPAP